MKLGAGGTATRYKVEVLARGNSLDQALEFRNFRGRDVDTAAFMRYRGIAPPLR